MLASSATGQVWNAETDGFADLRHTAPLNLLKSLPRRHAHRVQMQRISVNGGRDAATALWQPDFRVAKLVWSFVGSDFPKVQANPPLNPNRFLLFRIAANPPPSGVSAWLSIEFATRYFAARFPSRSAFNELAFTLN